MPYSFVGVVFTILCQIWDVHTDGQTDGQGKTNQYINNF